MKKKPPSAKSKAAKAKREKMSLPEPISDEVRQRLEDSFERTWNKDKKAPFADDDIPWRTFPSEGPLSESDILTAEEVQQQEEKILGKQGPPSLNDDIPGFLQAAAKAGPPLDHLGRTEAERKKNLPAIIEPSKKPVRAVTIMRDHDLQYPDLYMAVFVAPDWDVRDDEARFARLLSRSGCYRADSIEEADLVVFGGGSDVEPLLYGESNEERHSTVCFNTERDAADIQIYLQARDQGTPMMGVCRGAQFLHVMNGGKLYQDIDGHMGEHKAYALRDQLLIEKVSSVHHQSCVFNKDMEVLLTTANQTTVRWLNNDVKDTSAKVDIEAFYYRDSGCFGVQGHPEYSGCNKFSVWCLEQLNHLFLCSPDFEWADKRLQMTKSARDAQAIAEQYVENAYNKSKEV
jgi:gamma-glutamyl-gamma-aminobutyrate hydrolase PuuD